MTSGLSISDSVYYPIASGKPDPNVPGCRKTQKGAVDGRCMHYAMRMITPRRGDSDYPVHERLQDRDLSLFSKNSNILGTDEERVRSFGEFCAKKKIELSRILKPVALKNLQFNSEFAPLREFFPDSEEKQIQRIVRSISENPKDLLTVASAYILKMYRDVFDLRSSSFECLKEESEEQTMERLIAALKQDGPMFVIGFFGEPYYKVPAKELFDPIVNPCFGWTKPREEEEEDDFSHSVVVCGAASFNSKGKVHHRVYFIDPNDTSDPNQEDHRKVYVMSVKNFRKYLEPFERLELPLTEETAKPCYGIQRKLAKLSAGHEGDEDALKLNRKEKPCPPLPGPSPRPNPCPISWRQTAAVIVGLTGVAAYYFSS